MEVKLTYQPGPSARRHRVAVENVHVVERDGGRVIAFDVTWGWFSRRRLRFESRLIGDPSVIEFAVTGGPNYDITESPLLEWRDPLGNRIRIGTGLAVIQDFQKIG